MHDPEIDYIIKDKLEKLFILCIENSGVYRDYTDEELFQATFIFQKIFLTQLHKKHKNKINFKKLYKLTKKTKKNLHQTILLFTKINLKNIEM